MQVIHTGDKEGVGSLVSPFCGCEKQLLMEPIVKKSMVPPHTLFFQISAWKKQTTGRNSADSFQTEI